MIVGRDHILNMDKEADGVSILWISNGEIMTLTLWMGQSKLEGQILSHLCKYKLEILGWLWN